MIYSVHNGKVKQFLPNQSKYGEKTMTEDRRDCKKKITGDRYTSNEGVEVEKLSKTSNFIVISTQQRLYFVEHPLVFNSYTCNKRQSIICKKTKLSITFK